MTNFNLTSNISNNLILCACYLDQLTNCIHNNIQCSTTGTTGTTRTTGTSGLGNSGEIEFLNDLIASTNVVEHTQGWSVTEISKACQRFDGIACDINGFITSM